MKKIDKHNLVSFLFSHFVSFELDVKSFASGAETCLDTRQIARDEDG